MILNQANLQKWLVRLCSEENYSLGRLVYTLVSDEELHRINVEFLNHDTLTDIITFDYCTRNVVFGEIFVSIERVKENSEALGVDFYHELKRILAHGLLHLVGYADKMPLEKKLMTLKEDYYLSLLPEFE